MSGSTCRICLEDTANAECVQLDCACRGDVGLLHKTCALQWFRASRTGACDVCAAPVSNVCAPEPLDVEAAGPVIVIRSLETWTPDPRDRYSVSYILWTCLECVFFGAFVGIVPLACVRPLVANVPLWMKIAGCVVQCMLAFVFVYIVRISTTKTVRRFFFLAIWSSATVGFMVSSVSFAYLTKNSPTAGFACGFGIIFFYISVQIGVLMNILIRYEIPLL